MIYAYQLVMLNGDIESALVTLNVLAAQGWQFQEHIKYAGHEYFMVRCEVPES